MIDENKHAAYLPGVDIFYYLEGIDRNLLAARVSLTELLTYSEHLYLKKLTGIRGTLAGLSSSARGSFTLLIQGFQLRIYVSGG